MSASTVRIDYRRLTGRRELFTQELLEVRPDCTVTFLAAASIATPVRVGGSTVLEPGAPIVWFTFPGAWHDIGRFHLADGTFTGFYANVLTPVEMDGDPWVTTDLALDVWLGSDGTLRLLDEEDFAAARRDESLEEATASRAEEEADRLLRAAAKGVWPPAIAREWDLARALATLGARG